jgi:colicin import membrane protein
MRRLGLMVLTLGLSSPGQAQVQSDERAELAAQRAVLAERFGQQERECQARFVVTACVDEARSKHRSDLQVLRDREWRLDQAQRLELANQKRQELQRKQEALAARPQPASAVAVTDTAATAAPTLPTPRRNAVQSVLRSAPSLQQAQAAAENTKAADQRLAKAAQAKARVKARVQKHEATMAARYGADTKRPAPLPPPGLVPGPVPTTEPGSTRGSPLGAPAPAGAASAAKL